MTNPEAPPRRSRSEVRDCLAWLRTELEQVGGLADGELLSCQRELAEFRSVIDGCSAAVAGEIGHRSRRELGHSGLAQREGFRSPEELVRHETGTTVREAITLVKVGGLVRDAGPDAGQDAGQVAGQDSLFPAGAGLDPLLRGASESAPWLRAVGVAVRAGTCSVESARAISLGLGSPTLGNNSARDTSGDAAGSADAGGVTVAQLAGAVEVVLIEAPALHADDLLKRARRMRDELDETGIAERERAIHQQRSVRRVRRANGVSRYIIDPDIESAAFWDDLCDRVVSPRRGGPRFVSDTDVAWAKAVSTDERTTEQYLHDCLTGLLRIAVTAETAETTYATPGSRQIVGSRQPSVRVLVSGTALTAYQEHGRQGHGRIEGSDLPVSIQTVERIACESGTIPIWFNNTIQPAGIAQPPGIGQPLDLGREQRLYSRRQRIAMAARDGGCMMGDCDRPPSWCEAHHIQHWKRDTGATDIADGILLCRFHHLLIHNNNWEIVRTETGYWLIPPVNLDPDQTPRPMPSKSAALRDLRQATFAEIGERDAG